MKNSELIVLGLAAVAVFLILRTTRGGAAAGGTAATKPPARTPWWDQYPTGPNGEGLY